MKISKEASAVPCPHCGTNILIPVNCRKGNFSCPKCHMGVYIEKEEK